MVTATRVPGRGDPKTPANWTPDRDAPSKTHDEDRREERKVAEPTPSALDRSRTLDRTFDMSQIGEGAILDKNPIPPLRHAACYDIG